MKILRDIVKKWTKASDLERDSLRKWERFKIIFKISFLLMLIAFSAYSYVGNNSMNNVYSNLKFPIEGSAYNLNFTNPQNVEVIIPYTMKSDLWYLIDMQLTIDVSVNYTDVSLQEQRQRVVAQSSSVTFSMSPFQSVNGSLDANYMDFNWSAVVEFLNGADDAKPILLVFEVSIYVTAYFFERDHITFRSTSIIPESTSESTSESTLTVNELIRSESIVASASDALFNITILVSATFVALIGVIRKRKKNTSARKVLKERKEKVSGVNKKTRYSRLVRLFRVNRNLLLKNASYALFIIILDIVTLENMRSISDVLPDSYVVWYSAVVWISIIMTIMMNVTSVILILKKRSRNYDSIIAKGALWNLLFSCFSLASILLWSTTSLEVYAMEDITVIRDYFMSYVPIIALFTFNTLVKCADLYIFKTYASFYTRRYNRSQRTSFYKPNTIQELNGFVLQAITNLNSKNTRATLTQIKNYFNQKRISTIAVSGEMVNRETIDKMVSSLFLEKKNDQSHDVYVLTPISESLMKDPKVPEYDEYDDPNYYETKYSDDDLIPCGKCGYYCRKLWGKCPICNTAISVETPMPTKTDDRVKRVNNYCAWCSSKSSEITCKSCRTRDVSGNKLRYCPSCGKSLLATERFCLYCYRSFIEKGRTSRYDNYDLRRLSSIALKTKRSVLLVIVLTFHLTFLLMLISTILTQLEIVFVVEILDILVITLVSLGVALYYRLRYTKITKYRINKDVHYKISITASKATSAKDFKKYQKKFKKEQLEIREIIVKIKKLNKIHNIIKSVGSISFLVAFLLVFSNQTICFLITFIAFFGVYPLVGKKQIRYTNELLQLGRNYGREVYIEYVNYINNYLRYFVVK